MKPKKIMQFIIIGLLITSTLTSLGIFNPSVTADTVNGDLLTNGNFETGSVSPWRMAISGSGNTATLTVSSDAYRGSYAGKIAVTSCNTPAPKGYIAFNSPMLKPRVGETYTLTFTYKASASFDAFFLCETSSSQMYNKYVVCAAASSWKTVSFKAGPLPSASYNWFTLRFNRLNTVTIDDISLVGSTNPSPTPTPTTTPTPTPGGTWNGGKEFLIRDEIHTFSDNSPVRVENCGWHFWYDTSRYPQNWYSPVDFYNGKIYTRWEIITQPTNTPCSFQIVWWKALPEVINGQTVYYELWDWPQHLKGGAGSVGTFSTVLSSFHVQGKGIDLHNTANLWRQGIAIIDDATGSPITPPSWGYGAEPWNSRAKWFPMKMRLTIVAVAAGATFSGWDKWVSTPPTDGYS
jgi:hypothetical protein